MNSKVARRAYSDLASLKKTPLYNIHLKHNGKMVDYAGFAMPVLYNGQTHVESHNWVRKMAGLFDVSHMVQHRFSGPDATKFLEQITPTDLAELKPYSSSLSVLLNDNGGIVDDTIITRQDNDTFYVVTNAGCRDKDLKFMESEAVKHGFNIKHELIGGGLIALQGPEASAALQKLTTENLKDLHFGHSKFISMGGLIANNDKVHVSRGGYTGEDGFEISIPDSASAVVFAETLLDMESVKPIGLAARDSLRLEAGMCLYGHELTEEIDPVAARLSWTIGKRHKAEGTFNGAKHVLHELNAKTSLLRSGLVSSGPAPRHGNKVYDAEGKEIGEITSGSMSPTLKQNVSMTYLPRNLAKTGTEVFIDIRGKKRPAKVVKLPFVPTNYYR